MTVQPRSSPHRVEPEVEVAVIGAGLAGLGTAIQLDRAGIGFVVLEKAGEVGGTWKVNTYPGVAVDTFSFNYSYSFVPYAKWSRAFAPGAELAAYAEHLADAYGLRDRIRFHTEVVEARFDQDHDRWRLLLRDGGELTARFLIHASGGLTQPKRPDLPGLADFAGPAVHTAEWPADLDLRGKRVGVIGTGASAVQVVPTVAPDVARLSVFQRTPIWVAPKLDFAIPDRMRSVFRRVPGTFYAMRVLTALPSFVFFRVGTVHHRRVPFVRRFVERYCRRHLERQVADPVLRERLTPKYGFACKRPVVSNAYLRTYERDNVELVTDGIDRVEATGVRTADGRLHELDVLVLATGFKVYETGNAPPYPVHGRGGLELGQFWHDHRYQAYEASTLPHWPNMFLLTAPYGLGGASYLAMVEAGVRHALRVIRTARERGATSVAVRPEANDAYFADLQRRQESTVFTSGACTGSNSYYFDRHGDAIAVRPYLSPEIWWHSRFSPLDHYEFTAPRAEPAPTPTRWLLLRGLTREQRHWRGFPDQLAARLGAEVHCLDLPGFGTEVDRASPASIRAITDDLRARFRELGDGPWGILGLSLGGMVALDWCARFPDDFARCVTVNSAANPSCVLQRFRPAGLGVLRARGDAGRERAVLRISSNDPTRLALADQQARWLAERRPGVASVAAQLWAATTFSAPTVETPVLVLTSRADRLVSHRCSEALAQHLEAPLRVNDWAGHDLPLDDPDWVCDQVGDWEPRKVRYARRPLTEHLDRYASDHRHPVNQAIHAVCVPAIAWTAVALAWVAPPVPGLWAVLALGAMVVGYRRRSVVLARGMLGAAVGSAALTWALASTLGTTGLAELAVGVFAVAMTAQFVGHGFEGKRPTFLSDLGTLPIGPLWVAAKLGRRVS